MQGFVESFPFVYMAFVIGSLAIMGFPFLTGFYSKDLILDLLLVVLLLMRVLFILWVCWVRCVRHLFYQIVIFCFFNIRASCGHFIRYLSTYPLSSECPWQMFSVCLFWPFVQCLWVIFVATYGWSWSLFLAGFYLYFASAFFFYWARYIHPFIKNLPVLVSLISMCMAYGFFVYNPFRYSCDSRLTNFLLNLYSFCLVGAFMRLFLTFYIIFYFFPFLKFHMIVLINFWIKVFLIFRTFWGL